MVSSTHDLVWHYTDAHALTQIITQHRLRATSAAFMNDRNELQTSFIALRETCSRMLSDPQYNDIDRTLLQQAVDDAKESIHDAFVLCACRTGDSLTMWRSYNASGSVPFAIGIDKRILLGPYAHNPSTEHPCPPPGYVEAAWEEDQEGNRFRAYDPDHAHCWESHWEEVHYVPRTGEKSHEDYLIEELDYLKREIQRKENPENGTIWFRKGFFGRIGHLDKDDAFIDEQEYRCVWTPNPDWKFVQYRQGTYGLTPYIEVANPINKDGVVTQSPINRLPIREVIIGPTSFDTGAQETSLRGLLDNNGYGEVIISLSKIPFR